MGYIWGVHGLMCVRILNGKAKDMGVFGVCAFLGRCGLLGYGGPMPHG